MLWKLSGGDLSVANENQHYITDVPAVRIDRGAWFERLEGQTFLIAESLDSCALLRAHGGGHFFWCGRLRAQVYQVFSALTYELAKMNLKDAAAMGLGKRMGAAVRTFDSRWRFRARARERKREA